MERVETSQNAEADCDHAGTKELVHTLHPEEASDCKMKSTGECTNCWTKKNVYLWKKPFDNKIYRLCEKCATKNDGKQLKLFII